MSFGASATVARRLYLSIRIPRFTDAADVWFSPVTIGNSKVLKSSGSVGFAKRLAGIQSTAAQAILGAMRSTPVDSLDARADLLPMHILMNEACQQAAICLLSAPSNHPLAKAVAGCAKGWKSHIPPLQRILNCIKQKPSEFEMWPLHRHPARLTPADPFPSWKKSLMDVDTDQAHIQVYTDGTASKTGVGAAAALFANRTLRKAAGK